MSSIDETFAARCRALLALSKRHDIDLDAPYSGAEDLGLMLDGDPDYPVERYALVTSSGGDEGGYRYIYCEPTLDAAKLHAFDNIDDDIYAELPIEIVDLDGGFQDDGVEYSTPKFKISFKPEFRRTPWTKKIGYVK